MISRQKKRKLFSLILAAALVIAAVPSGNVRAEEETADQLVDGDYRYSVNELGDATIAKYTGDASDLALPDKLGGRTVTGIGDYAFKDCGALKSVTIPATVTSVSDGAFNLCAGLTKINVVPASTSFTHDGSGILYNKDKTELIRCPEGETEKVVQIPDGVERISTCAFLNCAIIENINIPTTVISIGMFGYGTNVFNGCSSLKEIKVQNGITRVYYSDSQGLLYRCETDDEAALLMAQPIELVCCPGGIEGKVTIESDNSITSIGTAAFKGCSKVTEITIPENITRIDYRAFAECSSLSSITIPKSVTSVGDLAFEECTDLPEISVASDNARYTSDRGILYNKDKTELICCPGGKSGAVSIPSSVETIDNLAFSQCSKVRSITIPKSVKTIVKGAFYRCSGLTEVNIPNSITSIEYALFYGCTSLTDITIPESVTSIGDSVFAECEKLTSVTIPESVTSIGQFAFAGCLSLTDVTIPSGVNEIADDAFADSTNVTLIVEKGSYAEQYAIKNNIKYRHAGDSQTPSPSPSNPDTQEPSSPSPSNPGTQGPTPSPSNPGTQEPSSPSPSNPGTQEPAPSPSNPDTQEPSSPSPSNPGTQEPTPSPSNPGTQEPTPSPSNPGTQEPAPSPSNPGTQEPAAPGTTSQPDQNAPAKGDILTSGASRYQVTGATGNTRTVAYKGTADKNAKSVKVPSAVTIGGTTYKVTSIGAGAFKDSKKLTTVKIGNNVTSIGNKAFYQCKKLNTITVPAKIRKIGKQAFAGCKGLKSITVKSTKLTKKSVGSKAFSGINSKAKIKVPKKKLNAYKKLFRSKGIGKHVKVTK